MSSTFPQVFNLKLRKYVVHTLLINRYTLQEQHKIDWQIEIKKFVKSVKKRGQTGDFFLVCAVQNDISVSPRSLFFIAKVEDSFLPIQGFTIFCCAKWFWCQIYTLSKARRWKKTLSTAVPKICNLALQEITRLKLEVGLASFFQIWLTLLLFERRDKNKPSFCMQRCHGKCTIWFEEYISNCIVWPNPEKNITGQCQLEFLKSSPFLCFVSRILV